MEKETSSRSFRVDDKKGSQTPNLTQNQVYDEGNDRGGTGNSRDGIENHENDDSAAISGKTTQCAGNQQESDASTPTSKASYNRSEVSHLIEHPAHIRLPSLNLSVIRFVEPIVNRYNRNVPVASLKVSWQAVQAMFNWMNYVCMLTMDRSLVYSPRDLSVFVRTKTPSGLMVDVALCTQDRTHRSNTRLDGDLVNDCGRRVGRLEDRQQLPPADALCPLVQEFVPNRVVHTIQPCRVPNLYTVELARSYHSTREKTAIQVSPSEIWGDKGHDRIPFDLDRSPQDRRLFAAWLICMTLFERETTTDEQQEIQQFLLSSNKEFEARRMTKNVNYEAMFRSRSDEYRDGRLSWPLVLALCLAENNKEKINDSLRVDRHQARELGIYKGGLTTLQLLCLAFAIGLSTCAVAILLLAFSWGWRIEVMVWFVPLLLQACGAAISYVNHTQLNDSRAWASLVRDENLVPDNLTKTIATQLLMSPSCRRVYSGSNLCFTGETFEGNREFDYQFTYEDLIAVGFRRFCDSWGREYLRVPKSRRLTRLERTQGNVDHFVAVAPNEEPKLLFQKAWYSTSTVPGGGPSS